MDEAARPATADDAAAIAALFDTATAELRAERGGELWARRAGRDQGFLAPEDGAVLAGTIDGTVVGYAVVRYEELVDGGLLAVLDDIYVDVEARGVGVGEALLDLAIAVARERGCVGIDSVALPGMRATKNFFEAAGMVARAIVVHRRFT
jgi:ribosomal protein S18 acetylase RimI-like enzyme